jgi:hypothetical protein
MSTDANESMTSVRRGPPRWVIVVGTVVALVAVAVAGFLAITDGSRGSGSDRQAEVKSKGAAVMPFDLDRTTHTFTDLADGGVQRVTANDATDSVQIGLIRQHLIDEVTRFRGGDFGDPKRIHGADMPGVAALEAGIGRVDVRYEQLADGAQIRFGTTDFALVAAVHAWFRAQSSDHDSPHQHAG